MTRKTFKVSLFIFCGTIFLFCLYLSSLLPIFVEKVKAQWIATPPDFATVSEDVLEETHRMKELRQGFEDRPNYIQYNAYNMLRHKALSDNGELEKLTSLSRSFSLYSIEPRGIPPLSFERWGGFWSNSMGMSREMDILTGQTAIDEALHLRGGSTGELTGEKSVSISDIEPLEIASHPWDEMMSKQKPTVHPIAEVIPNDYFVVHFKDLSALGEMEDVFSEFSDVFGNFYNLKNATTIRERVFDQLGIRKDFNEFVDDVALVLYDVELFSNTDYALILELKGGVASKAIAPLLVDAPSENHGSVGDFYVIATNPLVLDDIKKTHSGQRTSLADLGDYRYTLSVLGDDYEGFIFISDDFVRKLTGPEYRFSYWRRNEAFDVLESLQYVVFGYREITGKWPESLDQIIREGYISDAIAESDRYRIDEKGVIHHDEWGSIFSVTPTSQISIESVTPGEAEMYEQFKRSYHEMWVNFIDPVGIAIKVEDHIRFHTVILPLVEQSQYDWLRAIAGREPMSFSFLKNPDRITDFQITSQFNIDDILLFASQFIGVDMGEDDVLQEEEVKFMRDMIAEEIKWTGERHPLDAIGNEAMLGFVLDDIKNKYFDQGIIFAIDIVDEELMRDFIDHINELEPGLIEVAGEHQGVEYFETDTFFFEVLMAFVNNRLYLTGYEEQIKRIIEGGQEDLSWSRNVKELMYHIRNENNIMAFVNMSEKREIFENIIQEEMAFSFASMQDFVNKRLYRNEAVIMERMLENEKGDDFDEYYRYTPENWFMGEFSNENGSVYFKTGGERYDANKIKVGSPRFNVSGKEYSYDLADLKDSALEGVRYIPESFETLGVGFQFTPHGLDIRVAFNNPYRDAPADRDLSFEKDKDTLPIFFLIIIGLEILLLIITFFVYRSYIRSRNDSVFTPDGSDFSNGNE